MATRRLTRRGALILGLGGVMLPPPFIGVGKAMAENAPDTVVYVSNAASKEIYVLAMNRESGELTVIDKVPVPGTDKPSPSSMPMAVTPDRRFLYAALRSDTFPPRACAGPGERAAHPSAPAARRQHGLYRHRRTGRSAQRFLSRQQADDQPDRR